MAGTRRAADDRSNMNKIYKPVAGYVGNIVKEVKDFGSAYKKATDASGDIRPGADARAAQANKNYDAAKGQLAGALVGRRYDSKGKRK
jgi:hypothetical protein